MSAGPSHKRARRHDPAAAERGVIPPGPSTVDLHAHSSRSDGVLTPGRLIADVAAAGVRIFSLTDHDTLAGYRDLVRADAVPPGMTLIPGVEINALVTRDLGLWEGELHILGFGMDPDDEAFEAALAAQRASAPVAVRPDRRSAARDRHADRCPGRRRSHRATTTPSGGRPSPGR